jgi:hypothetical protein
VEADALLGLLRRFQAEGVHTSWSADMPCGCIDRAVLLELKARLKEP